MPRTFNHAHTAAEAGRFINHGTILCYFDGSCCTGLFADTAADTADWTDLSGLSALLLIWASNHNKIRTFMNMNDFLRTFTDALTTGNALIFVNFRNAVLINCNGLKWTDWHADTAADTAIFTVLAFLHMTSAITGHNGWTIREFFLYCHFISSSHKGYCQSAEYTVCCRHIDNRHLWWQAPSVWM